MNFDCSTSRIVALTTAAAVIATAVGCSSKDTGASLDAGSDGSPPVRNDGSADAARRPINGQSNEDCSATAMQGSLQGKLARVMAHYPVTDATASDVNIEVATDFAFRCPTRALARLTTAHGTEHFYLYSFEFGRAA